MDNSEHTEHEAEQRKLALLDEVIKADFRRLIDELDADQLVTLRRIIELAAIDREAGCQLSGVITGCLVFKHERAWSGHQAPWTPEAG